MSNKLTIVFLLSILIFSSYSQSCFGSTSDDLIQAGNFLLHSGTVDIINSVTGARQTLAQSPILYTIPAWGFQTAFSLIDLQYNAIQGIDFLIRGGRIANSNFLGISLLLLQDRRWQRVKISFLVNSRKDVWLGSFTYSPYLLNSAQNNSGTLSSQISGVVQNWDGNSTGVYLSAVFLSGLQTGLSNFGVVFSNITFDKVRGVISLTLTNATRGIDLVSVSYLIFVSPHSRFSYDSFAYPGALPVADYGIIGSSGFTNNGIIGARYYGINIRSTNLNCKGVCPTPCVSRADCTAANGTVSSRDCIICPSNTRFNETRNACIPLLTCGVNEQLINNGSACQCVSGFIKLGEVCVSRCGINQEWNGSTCVCIKGHANITNVCRPCPTGSIPLADKNTCQCQGSTVFDDNTLRCVQFYQCPENSTGVIEGGIYRCKCNTDFYLNLDKCVYCPAPGLWNSTSQTCYCSNPSFNWNGKTCITCGSGQVFNPVSRLCECLSPRTLANGQCKCPNNLVWNETVKNCECLNKFQVFNSTSNSCTCAAPYIKLISGECGLVCPQNEWWSAGQCKCKTPFVRINGKCTMNCSVNEKWNGIECACVDGWFRINGTCATCQVGMFYNSTAKICQSLCGVNEVIVNGTNCICKENFYRINKVCSQCPTGTGFRLQSGTCVPCEQNEVQWNSVCVCKVNYYIINGSCGQCPDGTTYNKDKQICDSLCPKTNEIWDGKVCVCSQGFDRINGTCNKCQEGTVFNKNTQSCESICKSNEVFNAGVCVCALGFDRISGTCGKCPAGTVYNKNTQVCDSICKTNQVYSGIVSACVCLQGYSRINGVCDQCPVGTIYNTTTLICDNICKLNEVYNFNTSSCVCALGFNRINGVCNKCMVGTVYNTITYICESFCKTNEVFNGTVCVCADTFFRVNGTCAKCPPGTAYNSQTQNCDSICKVNEVFDGTNCVCSTGFNKINGVCSQCSAGTVYNKDTQLCVTICKTNEVFNGISCICAPGFITINGVCDKCPTNSYFDETLKKCVAQPTCPQGAQWDQSKLQCICSIIGQYLINGSCQACETNSGWNGSRCVCRTGFYLIGGQCVTCDINSSYNSTLQNCICNRGFYGDRNQCLKCDSSCGKCSGPNANQCLDCVDVSYTLSNGVCSKPPSCVAGMYLSGSTCKPCSSYCSSCKDENTCTQCTSGFSLTTINLTPTITFSMCEQICGDGKRYEYACDDGNTVNGDGCNDQCQVQNGWSCAGGSTTSKSVCAKFIPTRSVIIPKGAVQGSGKVMQGVTLSYLPDALTTGGCPKCSEVLMVSIIQAQVIPSFRVNFLPTTQYKYLIEFDFHGIFGIPPFTFTLKINPDYSKYFTTEDMAQQLTITVDPAVLAIGQQVEDLTIQEILGEKIAITDGDLKKVFS